VKYGKENEEEMNEEREQGRIGRQKFSTFGFDRCLLRLLAFEVLLAGLVSSFNLCRLLYLLYRFLPTLLTDAVDNFVRYS
jgi:hypothetical protein